jgi:hypothetical protein
MDFQLFNIGRIAMESSYVTIAEKTFEFTKRVNGSDEYVGKIVVSLAECVKGQPVFWASGSIHFNKDGYEGYLTGQCLDEFLKVRNLNDKGRFMTIHDLWKRNHKNDLHAGTPRQEEALTKWMVERCLMDYRSEFNHTQASNYLKSIGLYNDNGYKYGSRWLYRPISDNDMATIKELLEIK